MKTCGSVTLTALAVSSAALLFSAPAYAGQTVWATGANSARVNGPFPANARLILTAPRQHCSKVIYTALFWRIQRVGPKGKALKAPGPSVTTHPLGPGESEWVSAGGAAKDWVEISAEGVPGGCYQGQLGNWGVTVDITTARPVVFDRKP